MALTPIPDDLIHTQEQIRDDSIQFENLVGLVRGLAEPYVRDGLMKEAADEEASLWIADASTVLSTLLKDPGLLAEFERDEINQSLADIVTNKIPPPTREELENHATELANTVVRTWLDALHESCLQHEVIALDESLLPVAGSDLSNNNWKMFFESLLPFVIEEQQLRYILKRLALNLLVDGVFVHLPLKLSLFVSPKPGAAYIVTRAAIWKEKLAKVQLLVDDFLRVWIGEITRSPSTAQETFILSAHNFLPAPSSAKTLLKIQNVCKRDSTLWHTQADSEQIMRLFSTNIISHLNLGKNIVPVGSNANLVIESTGPHGQAVVVTITKRRKTEDMSLSKLDADQLFRRSFEAAFTSTAVSCGVDIPGSFNSLNNLVKMP